MKVVDIWPLNVFPAFIFQSPLNANDHVVQKGFFQGIEGNKIKFIFLGYAEKKWIGDSQPDSLGRLHFASDYFCIYIYLETDQLEKGMCWHGGGFLVLSTQKIRNLLAILKKLRSDTENIFPYIPPLCPPQNRRVKKKTLFLSLGQAYEANWF